MDESRQIELCSLRGIHHGVVQAVRRQMPAGGRVRQLAEWFKLFGDGTRLGILWALSLSEMCVCDLCALLDMKQSAVSHQLRHLKQARIVRNRREGKVVYYALDDEHIGELLRAGMAHLGETVS
jgi:ArsR family transcriptional regulator